MKKTAMLAASLLILSVFLAGCFMDHKERQEPLKVYSFSGDGEYLSVSNGVLVVDGENDTLYGGDLTVKPEDFPDIASYTTTIYLDGMEQTILLSNSVTDVTGDAIQISKHIGKVSGDIFRDGDPLDNHLWFSLKTINLRGEENTYPVQLQITEVIS